MRYGRNRPASSDMETSPDRLLLDRLDAYVDALRAGAAPDRAGLAVEHPEAAALLECLEDLDRLARAAAGDGVAAGAAGGSESPTPSSPPLPGGTPTVGTPSATPTAEVPPPSARFGKYELLQVLGRGGMGIVYRARQTDLDRIVALKMIVSQALASPEQVARFEAEARAAAGLRHPHVLPVYEAGQIDGQHYFAMECVDGPSLADVVRTGPLSPDDAARCLRSVARAVGYLHARGIVHRDLKPGNILLDAEGHPYVADFGLVKMLAAAGELTGTGAVVGTSSYMAPEQAAGDNTAVGPLSDVYSLGAILYEALTGRPPFREATPLDTLVQVLEGEPELPRTRNPRIPPELELVCLKAMAKPPEERYPSADALADDLDRFLADEPVRALPETRRQRLVRWVRQEPGLEFRLGLIATCAAIAQGYYLVRRPVSLEIHGEIMLVLALWAAVSAACQGAVRRAWRPDLVRRVWLALDGVFLTAALVLDGAFAGPLVFAYAVHVVASGLFFRLHLVWFTTAVATLGYAVLIAVGAARRALGDSPQHHVIVMVALVLVGAMVAAQVKRVRALSRYYEHRTLP